MITIIYLLLALQMYFGICFQVSMVCLFADAISKKGNSGVPLYCTVLCGIGMVIVSGAGLSGFIGISGVPALAMRLTFAVIAIMLGSLFCMSIQVLPPQVDVSNSKALPAAKLVAAMSMLPAVVCAFRGADELLVLIMCLVGSVMTSFALLLALYSKQQ